MVDRLTKYAHLLSLSHPYSASKVAKLFMEQVYKLDGMPEDIVSYRDPILTRKICQELFSMHGVTLNTSTTYHPQTAGHIEVINMCLEHILDVSVLIPNLIGVPISHMLSGGILLSSIVSYKRHHMMFFMDNPHP